MRSLVTNWTAGDLFPLTRFCTTMHVPDGPPCLRDLRVPNAAHHPRDHVGTSFGSRRCLPRPHGMDMCIVAG
jgi:hypothetical protein